MYLQSILKTFKRDIEVLYGTDGFKHFKTLPVWSVSKNFKCSKNSLNKIIYWKIFTKCKNSEKNRT